MPKEIFTKTVCSEDLPDIAKKIADHLLEKTPFHLHLLGELGAGKTTLMRYILQNLGLDKSLPVNSPTFSYLYEYEIQNHYYAHLDLYRIEYANSVDVLDLLAARDYRGIFTEWPQMADGQSAIAPTHILNIEYPEGESLESRIYHLQRC